MVLAYAMTIFYVSSLSGKTVPAMKTSDKLLHAVEFGGLSLLLCRALWAQVPGCPRRSVALMSVLITIGYGISDELHQWFVPGREADVADVVADSLGALGAAWVWVQAGKH
jgi:VanZ family protein